MPAFDPERLLLECEGFLVDTSDGREIGVVDAVETAGEPPVATTLLIAAGWFGRRQLRVSAMAVEALLPDERRVIVDESSVTSVGAERRG